MLHMEVLSSHSLPGTPEATNPLEPWKTKLWSLRGYASLDRSPSVAPPSFEFGVTSCIRRLKLLSPSPKPQPVKAEAFFPPTPGHNFPFVRRIVAAVFVAI